MKFFRKFADNKQEFSLANKLRLKRFALFKSLISPLPRPLKILDVGGTQVFWERMGFTGIDDISIMIINLTKTETTYPNFKSVVGDAKNLSMFRDNEFDIVFSNSVIEHVGDFDDQRRMAEEVKRVGKRYFIQTPNRYFPVEPHFLFPFFQFLPLQIQVFLLRHFEIGWNTKIKDKQKAIEIIKSIRLLTKKELKQLFPGATIYKEKFFGLTKSFIVYKGWNVKQ